jgi:FtsP/CotA-like multicopper oxidase with cupredoxin domain
MLLLLAASLLAGVAAAAGVTRQHFLAAELIEWNYLPLGVNGMDGTREGDLWQEAVPGQRIGPARMKALYVEYTDGSYTTRKARPAAELHRGFLGPLLRAEVGDTLQVTLRNNLPPALNISVSAHPHGVRYTKASEGVPYEDATGGADKQDDAIAPGDQYTCMCVVAPCAHPCGCGGWWWMMVVVVVVVVVRGGAWWLW